MALTYNKATRDLSIKGTITFNDGTQRNITDSDILNYSFDPQIGSEGLPLGSTESTAFNLEISNVGRKYTPEQFDNAEIHMFIGIRSGSGYVYSDFGVWYVDSSSAPEQSVSISLYGYDALATRFTALFTDDEGAYPTTTIGSLVQDVCMAAGVRLKDISFPNAAVQISKMPKWADDTTLRDVLSYCAICAGGFARIALNGQLEIVSFADGAVYTITPDLYQTFTPSGGTAFAFNAIEAMLEEDAEEYSRFAVKTNISPNATNTIQIDYNPLLTEAIVQSIVTELSGVTMNAAELTWGGDPSVNLGDYYMVETLNGKTVKMMVTAQSFSFEGGLSVTETCSLPTINSQNSATYSTSTNMYDAKGNIRATRISGLDKKVITATTGHFENLTAETAEIDTLLVSMLNAVNLIANMIDAKVIKAGTITAEQLSADVMSTDLIKAGALEAVTAKIESLRASDIATDRLAAALAAFTVISAGTANFDKATVEHLVANLFNLTGSGVMEDVFIHNLKIAYAQVISATIGNLVLMSSDGKYYQIDINSEGSITASEVFPTEAEKAEGVFGQTRPIIATTMTVDDMNAGTVKAVQAVINRIYAAQIDTDELWARKAFIDSLNTADISNNGTITIIAGKVDDAQSTAKTANNNANTALSRSGTALSSATYANNNANTALTRANDASERADTALSSINTAVASVDVEYYLSESATELIGGEWDSVAPEWVDGKYMWSRTVTALKNGTVNTSDPTCIAGAAGKGITGFVEQYYISDSKSYPSGGEWITEMPDISDDDKYIWTRSLVIYTDGEEKPTDPVLNTALEFARSAKETADAASNNANDALDKANAAMMQDDFERVVRIDDSGLHVGDNKTNCEMLIDSASINMVVEGKKLSTLSGNFIRFGKMQIRKGANDLVICAYKG